VGLAFYVYRELLADRFLSLHDYQVAGLRSPGPGLVELALAPVGRAMRFVAGQFAMIYLETKDGWHRHPFTISSAPHEEVVRVTVKALGDYTSQLHELVEPGMPAVIGGPHGRFDRRRGSDRQIWIAAGVGVAPFLSWIRALDGELEEEVDFFYTADGTAPFAGEILAVAERHPSLRVHLVDTSVEGRLTPTRVLEASGEPSAELTVYMCGPQPMLRLFEAELRRAGVRRSRIHREHFDWR
jgi:predicted ferric reductase